MKPFEVENGGETARNGRVSSVSSQSEVLYKQLLNDEPIQRGLRALKPRRFLRSIASFAVWQAETGAEGPFFGYLELFSAWNRDVFHGFWMIFAVFGPRNVDFCLARLRRDSRRRPRAWSQPRSWRRLRGTPPKTMI